MAHLVFRPRLSSSFPPISFCLECSSWSSPLLHATGLGTMPTPLPLSPLFSTCPTPLVITFSHGLHRILLGLISPSHAHKQSCHVFVAHWIDIIDMDDLFIRNCYSQLIISFINDQLTLILEFFWLIQVRCDPMTSRWAVGYPICHPRAIHLSGFRVLIFHDTLFPDKSLVTQPRAGARLKSVAAAAPAGISAAVSFHEPLLCTDISEKKKKRGSILNFRRWTSWFKTDKEEKDDTVTGTVFMKI